MNSKTLIKGLISGSLALSAAAFGSVSITQAPPASASSVSFLSIAHADVRPMTEQDVQNLVKEFPQVRSTASDSAVFQITVIERKPDQSNVVYKSQLEIPSDIPRASASNVMEDIPYEAQCSENRELGIFKHTECTKDVVHVGLASVVTLGNDDVVAWDFTDSQLNPASKIELNRHHLDNVMIEAREVSKKFVLKPGDMVALSSNDRAYFISRGGSPEANSW